MEFEDIATSRLICPPQIQPPDQTSSRFIDRFIRVKTRYWNRGFLIVFLTFIGLTIQWFQNRSLVTSLVWSREIVEHVDFIYFGWIIGYILGGTLATIYPADKVFGVSFIISSTLHSIEDMKKSNGILHIFSLFCIGITMTIGISAFHRIYTFWVPLNKQSLRHVPIVLWTIVYTDIIQIYYEFNDMQKVLGIVGNRWFIIWLIVVSGDRSQSRYSGTNVVSLRRPTISGIPWKSFCTSMPVIALVLSYMCSANLYILHRSYYDSYEYLYPLIYDQSLSRHTTILLFLTFVLIELIPKITGCSSITNVRKIFSCLYFLSMGVIYYMEAFPDNIFLFLDNKIFVYLIYNFMPYFSLFGFEINHLDIAPQYSSVLFGILMTTYHITWLFSTSILKNILIFEELSHVQLCILRVVISLAVAVFYAIFASAELQPWAVDKPVKENQRNIQEEVNLMAV
ncbi:probable vesicular glutamate transporter eat-4 [Acyrthosiphon pisum]|uniref:Uncharacterized protein n=1 Tax=Acyrthosiphon pisum TaxID=7029 RepID=A0A8R2H951_ACYPI|nr:probable vesicular glutamate transporter eat-4 [Acyrthosiphon pisum]XP_016664267.1 probable vesicular glutamate transporter eat-4 [Acyrthosiphon pisum]XP_029344479.1 probable vesicular glutamate transporter eat-4 [Acyrthosiphon pisum]XP_029344480.1 probable vesicular glutamate transporter eat-4 [Acyrthosiphon pisum]XP_029344481.1 probable vesicular glutamate transporter eat-4 [Acyrthosiphon pisum]|eukprot:XP_008188360.2 PREDICTED: probable vesicular glutamate transporter eat-4 [Acyrthosiphon pisum]